MCPLRKLAYIMDVVSEMQNSCYIYYVKSKILCIGKRIPKTVKPRAIFNCKKNNCMQIHHLHKMQSKMCAKNTQSTQTVIEHIKEYHIGGEVGNPSVDPRACKRERVSVSRCRAVATVGSAGRAAARAAAAAAACASARDAAPACAGAGTAAS